ncbi:MAG TPA: 2-isopropylmalate synthase [Vicinamibacterales bacterium]|nr:2-isopropylmalate synthase [Vicinamibacterales bacterium]
MATSSRIQVFDTTLRDGEQAPGFSMTAAEKLRLAQQLDRLGVDIIEAGFPISSEGDFEAVRTIAGAVRRPIIAGLARAIPGDIDRAWAALSQAERPRIHVFLATSDIHLEHKLRISRTQCLEQVASAVAHARQYCDDVEFSAEDATRSDLAFLCAIAEAAVNAGATTINLPDTVGYALPADIQRIFSTIAARIGTRAVLSAHCHNDLGLAVANSLAAIQAGARQVECTINGIGERAGNASLEEIVMALEVRADALPHRTGIHTPALVPTSNTLSSIVGVAVPPNKAVVGANAFAHEAGIHQDGMLKYELTYEIMRPESVGAPGTRLVLGKHSGMRGLDARCRALGHRLRQPELERLYTRVTALADRTKTVDDAQLTAIIQEELPTALAGAGAAPGRGDATCH